MRLSVLYCDYVASGRALKFIEDYIRDEVLPAYANTHTTTSVTGLQTTLFRHEARSIIRDCVNAGEHDAVIFAGSGCTGAVHLLINSLTLSPVDESPIVIAGPYDHHSTLLPWREIASEVYQIGVTEEGSFDMGELHSVLKKLSGTDRKLIGCMSAASNITGNMLPVDDITICLHKAGALVFWDYAMAAPYVELNMNPFRGGVVGDDQQYIYKDAMFISTHKFIGGPSTPGILVAKKELFTNPVPSHAGGGTVFYVRREHHTYLKEIEVREEGGTPDIIGSIRAGLVFQLKRSVGVSNIVNREKYLYAKALAAWKDVEGLVILGSRSADRLPVFSMMFRKGNKFLHHNYAAALLDDVFGIQSRGGCACAGPYAHNLLGINEELAVVFEETLIEDSRLDRAHLRRTQEFSDKEILRPGFVRLNLPYFMTDEEVDFVIAAVKMVAADGWKLLPRYLFNPTTGEWKVRHHEVFEDRKWLGAISYTSGKMSFSYTNHSDTPAPNYQQTLEEAQKSCCLLLR
ncbi:hypothetical protein EB796_010738 [Bugula neritina]|uniref:Aminotransferase class V domain-containing protein n=1 Tax=Bugula neritina TaxID=10212 RepID=A0A7J7K019_BUGNE|nr:hypothetical protein EB796_010738 [Bugula neritina]